MNLDSKSLPWLAALLVLVVAGFVLLGRGLLEPSEKSDERPQPAAATEVPLHPKQVEARIAIREGRMEDARKILASVPPEDPAYPRVLADRAVLLETTGQPEAALAMAATLLGVDPENATAHFVMARAYYALGDYARAENACLRSLEIDPANASARYSVALIRLAAGQLDRSIDAYLRAMRYGADQARVDEALTDLTLLEQSRPDLPEVHYAMAFFANSLGARDQEILELERYLEAAPEGAAADGARARLAALGQ